jgi:hypothetical protein
MAALGRVGELVVVDVERPLLVAISRSFGLQAGRFVRSLVSETSTGPIVHWPELPP